jgi:hypothetical protein
LSELRATKSIPLLPAAARGLEVRRVARVKQVEDPVRQDKSAAAREPPADRTAFQATRAGGSAGAGGAGTSEELLRLLEEGARGRLLGVAADARELLEDPPLLGDSDEGTSTWTRTSWSPWRPPRSDGMPRSRRRKVVPLWVPGGIFRLALPESVGTSIEPPSVASVNLIGISQKRSSPWRSKSSCSLTVRTM